MNHNLILGVAQNASPQEIQTAFRKKALEHHPDQNPSAEAAEAFMRIKEARDALMQQAELAPTRDAESIQKATDAAMRATAAATYGTPTTPTKSFFDDIYAGMTPDEIAYIQELDRLAIQRPKRRFLRKTSEPVAVTKHRKRLSTMKNRIEGKY